MDYGPFTDQVEKSKQRRLTWRQTGGGQADRDDGVFLSDHEFPEATAMWRDTFG
jgi:hypothetical protein